MTTITDRLRHILITEGLSQKTFAEKLHVSPQTVNNWLKRDSISREAAQQISDVFGYSLDWLLNGVGAPNPRAAASESNMPDPSEWRELELWDSATPLPDDQVEVPFLKDIELAAGDGSFCEEDYNGYILRFSKSTLRRVGAQKENVLCFPAKGTSMEPILPDGSTVAVNTADKRIVDGKMYAINQGGLKRIKQLFRMPGGRLIIRSFNKSEYPDENAPENEVEIIGKVFWTSTLW